MSQAPRELNSLTIAKAAKLIEAKKLSPIELTRALLSRIQELDHHINAFITVTAEQALAHAKQAESEIMSGRYRGPLHGIPIGIKDIFQTVGIPTTANSKLLRDFIPTADATIVTNLRAAGALMMGKLAAHEFAHGGPSFDLPWPPARNPWNTSCFTGGSSSGSAAAVAAGFVLGALGSDTGGSIRGPACLSGIAGLKPTYGLVSRSGVVPNSYSLDHCGPMAWTVEDCALMLQVIAGHDSADPASSTSSLPDYRAALDGGVCGMRIGVVRHFWEEDLAVDKELALATEKAIDVLRELGAHVESCRMRPLQHYRDVKMIIGEVELFSFHHKNLIKRVNDFGSDFLGRTLPACLFQAVDYVHAQCERRRMIAEMVPLYEKFDVLVTAGLGPAPLLRPHDTIQFWRNANLTTPFNVTGSPALALCCGFSSRGLPLGLQIVGRPFDDATVLRVGHAYEQATNWREERPTIRAANVAPPVAAAKDQKDLIAIPRLEQVAMDAAYQAGLELNEDQLARVRAAAPYVLEIAQRVRSMSDDGEEPASVLMLSH